MEDLFAELRGRDGHRQLDEDRLPDLKPQPERRHEPFPLTDIQQAYLIGRHKGLELGGISSQYYLEFDCPGLDVDGLTRALRKVVARHEALRTVAGSDQTQRILADDELESYLIRTTDLRGRPAGEQTAEVERIRAELTEQVLPVDRAPLFDIRATLLDGDRVRLHLAMDLLYLDMRSLFRLLEEWRRYYDDPAWRPEPLELSFRDYVLAQEELRGDSLGREAAAYWADRLDTLPPAPELPLAAAPEQLGTPRFVRHRAVLAPERWETLRAAADRHGLTPSGMLLAAYAEVVRTWSRRQEFTLTVTQFHRLGLHPQVEEIMGDFLSPGLLAVGGRPEETFGQRAKDLQRRLLEDLAHSTHGGIRVLRDLARRRDDGRASMPVVFSSTLGGGEGVPQARALESFGELVHDHSRTPQVWLENQILEVNGRLCVKWNAVEGLFPQGTLEAMFDAYVALLERLVDDESVWGATRGIVPLPSAQAEERERANATAEDIPSALLHELVAAAARRRPDAVAVITPGAGTTYRQLTQAAHRIAHRLLLSPGAGPNQIVAVSMRPGAAQISALLGVLHTGAAYVAIDPELPEERRLKLLARSSVRAVVTEPDLRDALRWPEGAQVVTPQDEATLECSTEAPERRQGHDDLAYVIFTSGSTGEPKGVMITHRSAANTVQDINRRFGVGEEDRVMALAPTGFDLSVYDIFGVLGAGGTVVVPDPARGNDIAHWSQLISRYGVTIWNSVPAPMRMWIDSLGDGGVPRGCRLRLALLSGDWIPVDLPTRIREKIPAMRVISLGGATEGSIWSIHHPIETVRPEWSSIPYGEPLANQTMHVFNQWLEPSPVGVTGEIHIGGTGVAQGYLGDPERTAERFLIHPVTGERIYRTGDLGRYLPGGDIEILGREDFQVKINGYRVELGEIEAALIRQPGVRTALVTAPAHARTGQRQIAAYVVPDAGADPDPAALREALASLLPGYMVPSRFLTLETLPLTANGKIDHKALPMPWNDDSDTGDGRTAPRSRLEERLFALWSQQLGHSDFGVEEGFFDIGGDSLHAVGLLALLRAEFGIGADAEQEMVEGLFMNASIASFAELIASVEESAA
ncbi:amino acid adenylation domain-containing protein [Streptomyces sp. RB6PN25]|uniref:Phenyloxazoline synthase MbtB n=1 Tax=Streptomyces humicola TaxID=2953240 RepID=A0ABT1Q2P4_9ACTN|nr:amino acid adenylation domain-containing protein [Streptomyces humicola]MCQ4083648.1 amino acid adenylation domain-containing protein [Streptomyces humicola]